MISWSYDLPFLSDLCRTGPDAVLRRCRMGMVSGMMDKPNWDTYKVPDSDRREERALYATIEKNSPIFQTLGNIFPRLQSYLFVIPLCPLIVQNPALPIYP